MNILPLAALRSLLLTLILGLTISRGAAQPVFPAQGVLSEPRPHLLAKPLRVLSAADRIEITARLETGEPLLGPQAWLLAAPPGDFEVVERRIVLRNLDTGALIPHEEGEPLRQLRLNARFRQALTVVDLGVMRRVRLIAVRLDPDVTMTIENQRLAVAEFDLALSFPAWQPQSVRDEAFTDRARSFRRLLDLSVVNPEALDLYAQASPLPTPDDDWQAPTWQPRPEDSPDFAWLKIPVTETRLYALDGRWLAAHGLDPRTINPDDLRLMARGEEVATIRVGPAGAGFAAGARLIFWGQRNSSAESDERIYWLGRRPDTEPAPPFAQRAPLPTPEPLDRFRRLYRIEEDLTLQTKLGSFLSIREMRWVWHPLQHERTARHEFVTDGLPDPVPAARGRVLLYTAGKGLTGVVTLRVELNGTVVESGLPVRAADDALEFDIPAGLLRHDRNTIALTLQVADSARARTLPPIFLDAFEIEADSLFKAREGQLDIALAGTDAATGDRLLQAVGFRPFRVMALDITDATTPVRLHVEDDAGVARIHAHVAEQTRLLLIEEDVVGRAPAARASRWQDWRNHPEGADILVLHHELFADQASALADDLRATGRSVLAIDVESVYEDFGAGELSSDALRAFVRHAVTAWRGRRPETLILVGDCTSDGQRVARNDVRNYVPTRVIRQSPSRLASEFASDAFYAWTVGDDELSDLFVGRLSVASVEDADEVLRKTRSYRAQGPQDWAGRVFVVSDPGEFHAAAHEVRHAAFAPWIDERLLSSAELPWEDNFYLPRAIVEGEEIKVSPLVTRRIQEAFESGHAIVSFIGHGSPNIWSNQRVWFGGDSENSDNLRLTNGDRLPFVVTFTCNNGAIDYPVPRWNITIIEDMMRVRDGGAIAAFVPTGPGFAKFHKRLAEGLYRAFGELDVREFGMLSEMSRLHYQAVRGSDDHSQMYLLLGDPTLAIPAPRGDLEVAVNPPVLAPAPAGPRHLTVTVNSPAPLEHVRALLKGRDGVTLAEAEVPASGTTVALDLEAELPVRHTGFRVVVQGRDAAGTFRQGGTTLHRGPADVVIVGFQPRAVESGATARTVAWTLENRSPFAAEPRLLVHRRTDAGREQVTDLPVPLAAGERRTIETRIAAPPGAWVLEAEVLPRTPHSVAPTRPSSTVREVLVLGGPDRPTDIVLPEQAFRLLPARGRTGQPLLETYIANTGAGTPMTQVYWNIRYPDGREISGERVGGRVGPAEAIRVEIPVRMELEMTADLTVEITGGIEDLEEADRDNNRLVSTVRADSLPDLRPLPDILVEPAHLADGLTVFVSGVVENIGSVPSWPARVGLFADGDQTYRQTLRSIPGQLDDAIPALAPGETWPFRLRWDPVDNSDVARVQLLVDSEGTLVEGDKANNRLLVPLKVHTRWDLRPRGIELGRSARPNTVQLIATIGNAGQTDAQRVSVWFYGDADQVEANYLGEVLLDRVPAGGEVRAVFEWDITGVDLHAARRPSFSMALKGSLQRISSVAD